MSSLAAAPLVGSLCTSGPMVGARDQSGSSRTPSNSDGVHHLPGNGDGGVQTGTALSQPQAESRARSTDRDWASEAELQHLLNPVVVIRPCFGTNAVLAACCSKPQFHAELNHTRTSASSRDLTEVTRAQVVRRIAEGRRVCDVVGLDPEFESSSVHQPRDLREAGVDAPLAGSDDRVPSQVAEFREGALERVTIEIVVDSRADEPLVVWSSCVAPGARFGRGPVDENRIALKSSSTTVNGRPDWKVPIPDSCQPSSKRLPLKGRSTPSSRSAGVCGGSRMARDSARAASGRARSGTTPRPRTCRSTSRTCS